MNQTFLVVLRPPRATFLDDATEAESAAVSRHFEYLQGLLAQGVLRFAGRCDDAEFGLALISAPDLEAAQRLVDADPAVHAGVFTAKLHPFRVALWQG